MRRRRRLTVRARLTLLYTGLFAACGAVVVVVSYVLVAQLGATAQGGTGTTQNQVPAGVLARCTAQQPSSHPDKRQIVRCISAFQTSGAAHQRSLTLSHLLEYSLITLAVVLVLAAALGWVLSGRVLRPVHRIAAAARAASEHNLSARVALEGPRDELRDLAETFDEMLDRLQAAFESQRRFIANASHELRTPLAVMRTTVDVVLADPASTSVELRAMGADVRDAVDQSEQLIAALLLLARNERGLAVRHPVDLATVVDDVLDAADIGDRRVHRSLAPAPVTGDGLLLERMVANLVDNAVAYNVPGGAVWLDTERRPGTSLLVVANTGEVVTQEEADRIVQPFQRLADRTARQGSGLGLAIVASIAEVHGGTVTVGPREGGGLCVSVAFPAAAPPAAGGTPA